MNWTSGGCINYWIQWISWPWYYLFPWLCSAVRNLVNSREMPYCRIPVRRPTVSALRPACAVSI
jgi:hypothetical protein